MNEYLHKQKGWPEFYWNNEQLATLLGTVRNKQGRLVGRMEALGFNLRAEAILNNLTLDIIKSNEIEGEILNPEQVRSSLARHLGMDIAGLVRSDRHIDGVVEMMLDATQKFNELLTDERLFGWHSSMFPAGRSGLYKITTGSWRKGPMYVVSGSVGKEHVHFEAPAAEIVEQEMNKFFIWFNAENNIDLVLKAGIAHLWFVTVHPFDDGNGRIARAITDLLLAQADGTAQRFYSMSAQIQKERSSYYHMLETTQTGTLDISNWLEWFLNCLDRALSATDEILADVLSKARFWDSHRGTKLNERQKQMLNRLLDHFEGKLTAQKWAKITKCSHDTALRDIQDLINKEILAKEDSGGRSSSYKLLH
jgi:Fic family protein